MKNLLLPPYYYYLLRIRSVFTSIDSGCKRTSDIRAKDFKGLFDCHCTRKEKKITYVHNVFAIKIKFEFKSIPVPVRQPN